MEYNFSLIQVIYYFLSITVFLTGLIILMKRKLKRTNNFDYNVFRFRNSFLLVGFIIALSSAFVLFNITTVESETIIFIDDKMEDIIDIDIPITKQPEKKELPKPPPPIIETVSEEDIVDDQPEFLSSETDLMDNVEFFEEDTVSAEPAPLPPPTIKEDDEPVLIVEMMPRFPGCEDKPNNDEREKCSQKKLMHYIYKNLKYPSIARENGIEGRVVIRFVVGKSGNISGVKILRDIGGGCGEEAAKVIKEMNNLSRRWIPGRQGGRKVKVYYTLPVVFKLTG